MPSPRTRRGSWAISLVCLLAVPVSADELPFEERVLAQEAIERVYYAHQIGATLPFEIAVPRAILERKVRAYMRKSDALEKVWQTPIRAEMLQRELERITGETRMPGRLLELYAALGNDTLLIQECVARPVLVDRLIRGFFAYDERIGSASVTGEDRPSWEAWWREAEADFDPERVGAVARPMPYLPEPAGRAPSSVCESGDLWDNGTLDDPLDPRIGHTAVWTGTEMIVWGGHPQSSGVRYDPLLDRWTPVATSGAPTPRSEHVAVWTGTEMVIWGGRIEASPYVTATGGRYDPVTDSWQSTETGGAPAARRAHTAVWTGNEMIVWGGSVSANPNGTNSGGSYSPASDSWNPVTTSPLAGRFDHAAVWSGDEMIVWGGWDGQDVFGNGGRYDPGTGQWTLTSMDGAPDARRASTAVWTGDAMVVWGGEGPPYTSLSSGGVYDPSTDDWTPTGQENAPTARFDHAAVWAGDRMIVWGGRSSLNAHLDTGGAYDPISDAWTPLASVNAPAPRSLHTAVWSGELALFWGGESSNPAGSAGGRYDPSADAWTPIRSSKGTEPLTAPEPRAGHTTVWTGSRMIVWGGTNFAYDYQTGGVYDPLLDAWTPTSTIDAPSARSRHTAIWTGQQMVVWGGIGEQTLLDTGGRYDPVTDVWSQTTTAGAPLRRSDHTAVWAGELMVVFGGHNDVDTSGCNYHLSSGGRYDPLSDTWAPTSPGYGRMAHTAVSDGSRMYIFGGYVAAQHDPPPAPCGLDFLAHGRIYDPATDGWSSMTNVGDPASRYDHAAVWSGNEMLVWGGSFQPGGRYDPATDSWRPMSEEGQPGTDIRYGEAVWTGSDMIVWGSVDPEDNRGGYYNPVTDRWLPMSTEDVPSPRTGHGAVWTGSEMIVWGGHGDNGALATGGRYTPSPDADGDGACDPEDPCPLDAPDDPDGDRVCEGSSFNEPFLGANDNCPTLPNPSQTDVDGDSVGDHCDLDDDLIYLFFDSPLQLRWQEEQGFGPWNWYRGDFDALAQMGEYTQLPGSNPIAARQCGLAGPQAVIFGQPPAGKLAFFLVTGEVGGVESDLGADSRGTPRPNGHPCP